MKKSIISLICVLLSLTAVFVAVYQVMLQNTLFPKIEVGVVVAEEDALMEAATGYISAMESVESICNFHYVTREQGESMLSENQLQVVMVLPATLYNDLNNLENGQATILLPEGEGLGNRMFSQLLSSGVGLLHVAEAGVKASFDVARGESLKIARKELGNFLALRYAMQAIDRMDTFQEVVISPTGEMTVIQYYFLGLLLCLSLLCGISFQFLFDFKKKALRDKLEIEGVGRVQQSLVKILLMTFYILILVMLVYVLGCVISEQTRTYFIEFEVNRILLMMGFALAIGVHVHLVYTLAGDAQQGSLLLLITNLIMVVSVGLIIPANYLPEVAQKLGNLTPLYGWNMLGQQMLYGEITTGGVGLLIWMLIEFVIGVYVSWKKA